MININTIKNLIFQITSIRKQYEKTYELTGERFNVFNILGLSTNEVRTHSAFISELLSPKGLHSQKHLYLNQFIDFFKIKSFDYENATLEIEKSIGNISDDKKYGGNIDIIITDINNNAIIIENKIYARDQENQLLRYYNFAEKNYNSFILFYLTLNGKEPSEISTNKMDNKKYICISYASDIIEWLEICKEKSVNQPIIRETLTQYIYLIKGLTGQSTNKIMNTEIVNKIVNDIDNLKTFFELHKINLMKEIKKELFNRFKEQLDEIAKELDKDLAVSENLGFEKVSGWEYKFKNPTNNYSICFVFCSYFSRLVYGIKKASELYNNEHKTLIRDRLGNDLEWSNWIWVKDFEHNLSEWDNNVAPWIAITDKSLQSNIKNKVKLLIDSLKDIAY